METTEALLWISREGIPELRGGETSQMKKAGEKVSQRDNDTAQGRGDISAHGVKASQELLNHLN